MLAPTPSHRCRRPLAHTAWSPNTSTAAVPCQRCVEMGLTPGVSLGVSWAAFYYSWKPPELPARRLSAARPGLPNVSCWLARRLHYKSKRKGFVWASRFPGWAPPRGAKMRPSRNPFKNLGDGHLEPIVSNMTNEAPETTFQIVFSANIFS